MFDSFVKRVQTYFLDHYLLCAVLDPRVHGKIFSPKGICKTRSILLDVAKRLKKRELHQFEKNDLLDDFQRYIKKKSPFDDATSWEYMVNDEPSGFWEEFSSEAPILSFVAIACIEYCAHAATCERVWSHQGIIHTPSRYCLSDKTVNSTARVKFHHAQKNKMKFKMGSAAAVAKKYSKLLRDNETMTTQFIYGPDLLYDAENMVPHHWEEVAVANHWTHAGPEMEEEVLEEADDEAQEGSVDDECVEDEDEDED